MNNQVLEIGRINLRGNVFDHGWFEHIKLKNGKPYMVAITVLGEIFYWYKPTEIRDERTNEISYKQKFKADKLQKNYQQLAEAFGFTKRQVKDACDYLEERLLIKREFRTITVNGILCNNVMFVEPIAENIKKISKLYINPGTSESTTLLHSNVPPSYGETYQAPTVERKTNTESTTKISTKNLCSSSSKGNPVDVSTIIQFWDANGFGHNNINAKQDLLKYLDDGFTHEVILKALVIASENNVCTLKYVKGILHKWENKGAKTLEAVDAHLAEFENNKKKGGKTSGSTKTDYGKSDESKPSANRFSL